MKRIEEQILASMPDRSVALYASAGSGKTRALVMRLIHLMLAGTRPGNIAAVTFTEKAAAEMKDRLFRQLEDASRNGLDGYAAIGIEQSDAPYGIKLTPDELYSELLAEPESLKVQTIHALCLWLIRRFTLESGLLPGFELADEARSAMLKDAAVEDLFSELASSGSLEDIDALYGCGITVRELKRTLVDALGMRSRLSSLELQAGGGDAFIKHLRAAAAEAGKRYTDFMETGRLPRLAEEVRSLLARYGLKGPLLPDGYEWLLDRVSRMKDAPSFESGFGDTGSGFLTQEHTPRMRPPLTKTLMEDVLKSCEPGLKGKARTARRDEIYSGHTGLWTSLRDEYIEACALHDDMVSAHGLLSFWHVYRAADERYGAVKNAAGVADFDDLELGAYRLLEGPSGLDALLEVEPRLIHYLVDEFQDTSDIQWELIRRLAGEVFAGEGVEGPGGSTLFAVGDMKQSIYRFRNANYRLMGRLSSMMEDRIPKPKSEILELTSNFRSAPEILDVVNETFSALMGEEYSPSKNENGERKGSVRLVVSEEGGEVRTLCEQVGRMYGTTVWDADSDSYRPAVYGDMAVLLRSRTMLPAIEAAFTGNGIPYRVLGGVGFFRRPEITALIALIRFVDDPDDWLSLEIALRSRMFGMSAPDAFRLFTAADRSRALAELHPDAHSLVTTLREKAGLVSCGELVDTAVFESGAQAAFSPGNPAAARNLAKLKRLAHDFDRSQGGSPGEFIRWLDDVERLSDAGSADPVVAEDTDGTPTGYVYIMTVHGAKGLEFPVVFLPGMTKAPPAKTGTLLVGGRDRDRAALRTASLLDDPPVYSGLREEEQQERLYESLRLLYVAMTRARDHLVMSAGTGKKSASPDSWLGVLKKAGSNSLFGDGAEERVTPYEAAYPPGPPAYHPDAAPPSPDAGSRLELPDPAMLRPIEPVKSVEYVSPSALAAEPASAHDTDTPWPTMLRGSIVHTLLESFGRTGSYDTRAAASRFPAFRNLPTVTRDAIVGDIESTLARVLENPEIHGLITSGEKIYHELELLVRDGGRVAFGSADLVSVTGDTARVIDYKTGYAHLDDDAVKAAFSPQLGLYGKAVRHALGVRSVELVMILVDRNTAIYL